MWVRIFLTEKILSDLCSIMLFILSGGKGRERWPKEWGCALQTEEPGIDLLLCASQTPQRQKRLSCRLRYGQTGTLPAGHHPFKEEDEWDSPHIVRFLRNVMSDKEIRKIKEIAKPKVRSPLVLSTFPSVPSFGPTAVIIWGTFMKKLIADCPLKRFNFLE